MSDADFEYQLTVIESQRCYIVRRHGRYAIITVEGRNGMILLRPSGEKCELTMPFSGSRTVRMSEVAHTVQKLLR
jgi:hypothetical protein